MKTTTMKPLLISLLCLSSPAGFTGCSKNASASGEKAATAAEKAPAGKEQAFLSTFRQAIEKHDSKLMDSLMLKDGTPAEVVEFFTMMLELPAGMKIERVDLAVPGAEETAKYKEAMEMPDGKSYRLPITPTRKLVLVLKEDNGNSTSTSSLPVAEKDGKLIIPMPVPVQ